MTRGYGRDHLQARPCSVAGCEEPRAVYGQGYVRATCAYHEALRCHVRYWARRGLPAPLHVYRPGRPGRPPKPAA
jgi:hypothetical protein